MVVVRNRFDQRARLVLSELKRNSYPNANSIAKLCGCSRNTANRIINRLIDEYLAPIQYDPSEKGYYLDNPHFDLPPALPPGKDELTALLVAKDIVAALEDPRLTGALESLWSQYTAHNPMLDRDLAPLAARFSCDSSAIGVMADANLLTYLADAGSGEDLRVTYESPWSQAGEKIFEGRIEKVHYSDGVLYVIFLEKKGRWLTLNTAFIKDYVRLPYKVEIGDGGPVDEMPGFEGWQEGFGIWSGDELHDIEVRIGSPAARYYATQRWHESQVDEFDGDVLVRRFRSAISPELVRRILGLGRFVKGVEPEVLRRRVVEEVEGSIFSHDGKEV